MAGASVALKAVQWFLRGIVFCCATIILGIFSYFLATLHNHGLHIDTHIRAVEGISGAGVLYSLIGLLFLCCLAGFTFTSAIAILLDLCFVGAFIYVACATSGGAGGCKGNVDTPFGHGNTYVDNTVSTGNGGYARLPSLRQACRLETASFSVAIVAIFFFLFSILVELALFHQHKKEKAFGPSPNNGYTAGRPRRKFWQRKPKCDAEYAAGFLAAKKRHPDSLPVHPKPNDIRNSYATDATAVGTEQLTYNKYGHNSVPAQGYQTGGVTGANEVPADRYFRTHQAYKNDPLPTSEQV
jgi:hypothetical protein